MTRETTNGLRYRLVDPSGLQLLDRCADRIVELQDFPAATLALLDRLRDRFVEERIDAPQDRLVGASAQPRPLLVANAERQKRRLLELEGKARLGLRSALFRERARHPDRLERLLAQVVRLLGVQREDLEGDRRIGHEQRDDRPDAELLERLQPVVPVGREVAVVTTDRDNRIEKPPDRLDHYHQPLDVRVGRIALIRSRLHLPDGQRDQQQGRPAKRVAVAAQHRAAVGFDETGQAVEASSPDVARVSATERADGGPARLSCVERLSFWAAARPPMIRRLTY